MKKIIFILGIIVLNINSLISIYYLFNPNNLELSKLAWFSGFDWTNLLPSSFFGNILLFGSCFSLFFVNIIVVKLFKN
jgi:hypothetical protein